MRATLDQDRAAAGLLRSAAGVQPGGTRSAECRRDEVDRRFPWMDLARATGGETISGNELRLEFEGPATFEAWLDAISSARKFVYFENYLVRDDVVGRRFRDALVAKAREGIPVHVIYDWVGCWATPRR